MSLLTRILRRVGITLEPLLEPHAETTRTRDAQLTALIREQGDALRQLSEQSAVLLRRTEAIRATDMGAINDRLAKLRGGVRRHSVALGRLADRVGAEADLNAAEQRVVERLERMARRKGPIVVGPWTGEVGFELLYWIPFVRWALEKYDIDASRVTVVSRGGTRSWYEGLGARYIDALTLVTPDQFRVGTDVTSRKQRMISSFDRQLLRRARALVGEPAGVLHPTLMYALFTPVWKGLTSIRRILDHARYRRIPAGSAAAVPPLPAEYVAVRFYFSACFPDTDANREFVARTVAALAEHIDVVMLNPGLRVDDHVDYAAATGARVHYVDMSSRPEENLAIQTAIIGGARALIGTYGGFSYLAPMCGVDAIAFYSERNYFLHHLDLVEEVITRVDGGSFQAIDVRHRPWLKAVFGAGGAIASTGTAGNR